MSDLPGQTTGGATGAPPGGDPGYQQQPQQPVAYSGDGPSGPRSGFWRRFAALLIDGIILGIVQGILTAIIDSIGTIYILSTLIQWTYYTLLEGGARGQTIGKMALGIRVYDFRGAGGSIGYGRAFVRQLVKIVSAIPLFLGYFWMLWDKEKQCWHDKAAGDVVVPVDAYPVS